MSEQIVKYVSQDTFEGHEKIASERFARDKERLDAYSGRLNEVEKATIAMSEMVKRYDEQFARDRKELNEHDNRIDALERQPAESWSKLKTTVVTAIISLIISALGGGMIALLVNKP